MASGAKPYDGRGGVLVAVGETAYGAYPLPPKQKVTIGRSGDNDVEINDTSISREHAVIHFGDVVSIEDLGSTNGTRVREPMQWIADLDPHSMATRERQLEPGEQVELLSGSIVMLGTVMLMFQARPSRGRPRRLWPHALFEERVEEECARAAREQRTFAVLRIRLTEATAPNATIDTAVVDKRNVKAAATTTGNSRRDLVEEILASSTRHDDVIAVDESGEYDVLLCPATIVDAEDLLAQLEEAFRQRGLDAEVGLGCYPRDGRSSHALLARAKGNSPTDAADVPHAIVVRDPQMIALHQMIDRVAGSEVTVLLLGETGVGKEVIAERLHQRSPRASGPLVRINCAALPEALLEGELFGHERGAFTGADKAKAGLIESAEGGTLFLDEIGEIPLSTQVKLLRVLEEHKVLRLGARTPTAVDIRIIAATNRDLEHEVAAGRFRQDLFFRLHVFPLDIPPLRERISEIEPLAAVFIASLCDQMRRRTLPRLSPNATAALHAYAWPGNIRELRNIVHRALLLCHGDVITEAHLPLERMGRT
nr:sigma 54-interacting transcriptional regulator [Deltaproteobacteria bacterium]